MIIYQSKTNNPYINIATEEYFLRNFSEDIFFLYINEPSIIVGKHQNTIAEINVPYVIENNLKVVRRLSGGGTVFHDSGNINYCFIKNGTEGHLVDFKKYSQPILDTLQKLNVNAYLRGKSDLVIDDLKFSGNAEHIFKSRILHHGTLLYSSNLENLNESIKADWNNFNDRAVRSNRSAVTNISSHLEKEMSITEFKQKVIDTVLAEQKEITSYKLTDTDAAAIDELVTEKYTTWKWNFAYSPVYEFKKTTKINNGELSVELKIEKGIIIKSLIKSTDNNFNKGLEIEIKLLGKPHEYIELKAVLESLIDSSFPFTTKTLLKLLF